MPAILANNTFSRWVPQAYNWDSTWIPLWDKMQSYFRNWIQVQGNDDLCGCDQVAEDHLVGMFVQSETWMPFPSLLLQLFS